jgi:hypothetical protein
MSYSRKPRLDAPMGMLNIQHMLDEEKCPGGQLYTMRLGLYNASLVNMLFQGRPASP